MDFRLRARLRPKREGGRLITSDAPTWTGFSISGMNDERAGVNDEDRFPKSSLVLIKENPITNHSKCLIRYFLGYGVLRGTNVVVFDNGFERWGNLIPKTMQKKKLAEMKKMRNNGKNAKSVINCDFYSNFWACRRVA